MTENEIRILIAETCGFRCVAPHSMHGTPPLLDIRYYSEEIPDYPNDLNAMHEAEKIIDQFPPDQKSLWLDYLALVVGWSEAKDPNEARFAAQYNSARATATQRCEALLKTLGKWKEENKK